ncbi:MAG TPA: tetratricopeptide repeat protein [Candidatus Krumholzibacteria bacterium]|nr:tetratricopeptide repeat protein [Candidatus Krumholzibacteria bacterium]
MARRVAIERAFGEVAARPGDADARWRLARLHAEAGTPETAFAHCDTALAHEPDHDAALSLWSKLLFDAGEHETAIEGLEAARARRGSLPEALRTGLALHYDALGRWEDSAREFESVRSVNSAKVYHVLRSDEFLDASELAERALAEDPDSAASHNNYGITLLYAGEAERAKAAFLRALALDPDLAGAMYNLAIVETYYFFDEAAGRDWFGAYRATGAVDDPDGLAATFAWDDVSPAGRQVRR